MSAGSLISPPTRVGFCGGGGGGSTSVTTPPSMPPSTPPGMPPSTPPTTPSPSSPRSTPVSGLIPTGISAGAMNVGPVAGVGRGCEGFAAVAAGGGGGGGGGDGTGASATNAIIDGNLGSSSPIVNTTAH